jgi:hypothetical protein
MDTIIEDTLLDIATLGFELLREQESDAPLAST